MDIENEKAGRVEIPVPHKPENSNQIRKTVTVFLLLMIGFLVGNKYGKQGYVFQPKTFQVVNQDQLPKDVDYGLLNEAIDVVNKKYIEKPPTAQQYLYGAIRGAVASTGDPYTAFFEPKDLETFKTDLKGEFDGIGAEISKKNGVITVVAPLDDTPAKKAGILAQDIILKVDGQSTENWTVEEAVSKIRGKKGTSVVLNIYRASRLKPFDLTIVRDSIKNKSVKLEFKEVEKNGKKETIALLSISRFGDDTDSLFSAAVNEILTKKVQGIVLDLRNNPGGYLETSVNLISAWVEEGKTAVTEERTSSEPVVHKVLRDQRLLGIKTLVLINGGSASASEILAGALKDHSKASLIGEKTFGKGSVQELVNLSGGAAVKVTIAKWVTPGGKNLNKDGLNPDIEVKLTEDDINNSKDPQMDKALEEIGK